jgi:hypothetical protein
VKAGLTAAIEELGPGRPPSSIEERQLALLPDIRDRAEAEQGGDGPRGPGRPAGAKNRRTQEWVDYLGGRYGTPLERLAQLYSADPKELSRVFGLTMKDAFDVVRGAATAALPYMHQKQPVSVDVHGKGRMVVVLGHIDGDEADQAAEEGLSMVLDLTAQNVEKSEG